MRGHSTSQNGRFNLEINDRSNCDSNYLIGSSISSRKNRPFGISVGNPNSPLNNQVTSILKFGKIIFCYLRQFWVLHKTLSVLSMSRQFGSSS